MQQIISSSNVTFVSNNSVLYDLQQTGSTGVLIRLSSNELTENSTLPQLSSVDIPDNVLLHNEETKLFIPSGESLYKCSYECMYIYTRVYGYVCDCMYMCICIHTYNIDTVAMSEAAKAVPDWSGQTYII